MQVAAFRLLEQPHTAPGLAGKLADAGFERGVDEVRTLLEDWQRLGLVFTDGGYYVHVAPDSKNQDLMRIDVSEPEPEPLSEPAPVGAS
jgi:hypothetical protein